ncbi:hypothetical protein [Arthrobacter sp. CAN_A2]|uniref:hypothetical protein n=1 Tax=Arthrobacter sp. CAN_A2 TaxID=2787718 RepID=UPI0018EFF6C9
MATDPTQKQPSLLNSLARGIAAGVAGTVVMTAFQQFVEMPLTGREASNAPANLAEKLLPIHADSDKERERLNWITHFALGTLWGSAYATTARTGLRGPKAVQVVFGTVYTSEVLLNTALGLYKPSTWSGRDWTIDIINKYVQATATGLLYDHVFAPARDS